MPWQVSVDGEGLKRVTLSLKDLTTMFKKHTVTATLQCTGNRRDMFNDVKPVKGLEWGVGACTDRWQLGLRQEHELLLHAAW